MTYRPDEDIVLEWPKTDAPTDPDHGAEWQPGRWWRVIYADQRRYDNGRLAIWCETSDEKEARDALETCPGGGVLLRLFERHESQWRTAEERDG